MYIRDKNGRFLSFLHFYTSCGNWLFFVLLSFSVGNSLYFTDSTRLGSRNTILLVGERNGDLISPIGLLLSGSEMGSMKGKMNTRLSKSDECVYWSENRRTTTRPRMNNYFSFICQLTGSIYVKVTRSNSNEGRFMYSSKPLGIRSRTMEYVNGLMNILNPDITQAQNRNSNILEHKRDTVEFSIQRVMVIICNSAFHNEKDKKNLIDCLNINLKYEVRDFFGI